MKVYEIRKVKNDKIYYVFLYFNNKKVKELHKTNVNLVVKIKKHN
jgi:hypothetical protein